MNIVTLTGRLTKDIEVKTTQTGKSVTMFTIAVDDGFGDKKKAYYPQIVVWGKAAELCGKYLKKGSKVAVNGKLTTRSYDGKNGKVFVTEVVANMYDGIEFLDSRKAENQDGYNGIEDPEIPF